MKFPHLYKKDYPGMGSRDVIQIEFKIQNSRLSCFGGLHGVIDRVASSQQTSACSKSNKETLKKMGDMFKVDNKGTRGLLVFSGDIERDQEYEIG